MNQTLCKFKDFEFENCYTHAFIFLDQLVITQHILCQLHYFYYLLVAGSCTPWFIIVLLCPYASPTTFKVTTSMHLI